MQKKLRPSFLITATLAICLAIGFWFQYQLTVSTIEYNMRERIWSELAQKLQPVAQSLSELAELPYLKGEVESSRVQSLIDSATKSAAVSCLLVDATGKILRSPTNSPSSLWKVGDATNWKNDRPGRSSHEPQYGRLLTASGERMAVRLKTQNEAIQLLVYSNESGDANRETIVHTSILQSGLIAFCWTAVLCAVVGHLVVARFNFRQNRRQKEQDQEALQSAKDLLRTRDAVIFGLAKLAESRDPDTGDHLERISLYTTRLGMALRSRPKYMRVVTPTFIRLLGISSVLHDIGKVGLEDTVLLKPGQLTPQERSRMQQHTLVAGECLMEIEQRLGASNFLQTAREIALHHHERWDGTGYPMGLSGEAIPLAARIVSIADVYDALRSKRIYKAALSHAECVRSIREGAGTQFDPELVQVFLEIAPQFSAIADQFANGHGAKARLDKRRVASPHNSTLRMTNEQESTLREVVSPENALQTSTHASATVS